MKIINPYNEIEHRIYNRTFLRNVQVEFDFDGCNGKLQNNKVLRDFINSYFNVTMDQNIPSLTCVELCDSIRGIKFSFSEEQARVSIDAMSYKSFADTMIPLIAKMVAYMEQICAIPCIKRLTIQKNNVWEVNTHSSIKDIYTHALQHTFEKQHVTDLVSMELPKEDSFKISKEANLNLGDGILKVAISTNVKDTHNADFVLDLVASVKNVNVVDILGISTKLNDIVYCAFHDIVSKDVIDLMEQKGGN